MTLLAWGLQLNFKIIIPLILSIFLSACGVKTAPSAPKGTALPSIPEGYKFKLPKSDTTKEDKEKDDLEQKDN